MRAKLLHGAEGARTYALVFAAGDEVMAELKQFADQERLDAADFSAIGAFARAKLAYFDWERKEYDEREVAEQVEVLALLGHVTRDPDGAVNVHAHCVLGRRDLSALGGHLIEARVRPTLEVVLTESPAHLRRRMDAESGLPLIDLTA